MNMRLIALICLPFNFIWTLGAISFPFIFGWQLATYVQAGYYPAADISSLASALNSFFPIKDLSDNFLGHLPEFMHDLHISLILMGVTGLLSAPLVFIANAAETAQREAIDKMLNSFQNQNLG